MRTWNTTLLVALLLAATSAFAGAGQASVGTGATVEIGSTTSSNRVRGARLELTINNHDASNPVFCGNSASVTSSTGLRIGPGEKFTINAYDPVFETLSANRAVYCIATGGTVTVSFWESVR